MQKESIYPASYQYRQGNVTKILYKLALLIVTPHELTGFRGTYCLRPLATPRHLNR